jgi:hypothetical protein
VLAGQPPRHGFRRFRRTFALAQVVTIVVYLTASIAPLRMVLGGGPNRQAAGGAVRCSTSSRPCRAATWCSHSSSLHPSGSMHGHTFVTLDDEHQRSRSPATQGRRWPSSAARGLPRGSHRTRATAAFSAAAEHGPRPDLGRPCDRSPDRDPSACADRRGTLLLGRQRGYPLVT